MARQPVRGTRRVIAGALAVLLLVPAGGAVADTTATQVAPLAITSACADAPAGRFADVSGVHQPGIDCIGWWGITQGAGDGSYLPDVPVRRDQMATFVARTLSLSGLELPADAPSSFDDIAGNVYATAIDQLAALGVVGGTAGGGYDPSGTVTRAQMASFLARAWKARTGEDLAIGDVSFPDIEGNVHADNILRIASAGLTGGSVGGGYDPSGVVTRAQMGTFLARLLALLVNEDVTAYPPANPVPMPGVEEPGDGVMEMHRFNDPLILDTFQVSLAPGEELRYTTLVSSPEADVNLWFHAGSPTDDRDFDCPPLGREGISLVLQVEAPGTPADEAERVTFSAGDCGAALRVVDAWVGRHPGEQVQIDIRNDSDTTLTRQMHVGQRGAFEPAVHPVGTTATYAFDAATPGTFEGEDLGLRHPSGSWSYVVEVAEASLVTFVPVPTGSGAEDALCPDVVAVSTYVVATQEVVFQELPWLGGAGPCSYELEVASATFLSNYVRLGDRLEVTVAPAA